MQFSLLRFGSEFPPASSTPSRDSCGYCIRGHCYSDRLTMFKTMKMCSGFLRTYKRPSPVTRFVDDLDALLDADRDNRGCNKRRSTNMTAG